MIYAHCDRGGVIEFSAQPSLPGLMCLGSGREETLREKVTVLARHAYDGKTLLVSGVPEADCETDAILAAERFKALLKQRMAEARS